jgi:hypothetical protein
MGMKRDRECERERERETGHVQMKQRYTGKM